MADNKVNLLPHHFPQTCCCEPQGVSLVYLPIPFSRLGSQSSCISQDIDSVLSCELIACSSSFVQLHFISGVAG
ncbi:unnamed protein product [Moneuplotes crassus]|uniref:Uncharacterized protein n=1 Tax=Euplotes crassus TaxID=5936 RepID=A0AAD1Y720_EUPCR|nr:unnamed protein product [Moneuplotes crassus]